jgi:hypothetical protein
MQPARHGVPIDPGRTCPMPRDRESAARTEARALTPPLLTGHVFWCQACGSICMACASSHLRVWCFTRGRASRIPSLWGLPCHRDTLHAYGVNSVLRTVLRPEEKLQTSCVVFLFHEGRMQFRNRSCSGKVHIVSIIFVVISVSASLSERNFSAHS